MRFIPDDNLSYPVLITLSNGGTGSGFFLNTSDSSYLVTAKHVLFDMGSSRLLSEEATLMSQPKDPAEAGKNIVHLRLLALQTSGAVRVHPTRDIVIVKVAEIESNDQGKIAKFISGATVKQGTKSGILGAEFAALKKLSEVLVANEVFLFGYPTSLALKELNQIDSDQPLLRKGIVAGINKSQQSIILDCPVYPGNSGGPVVESDHEGFSTQFRIIGIVSQFVPLVETWVNTVHHYKNTNIANSGYSVVVPIDCALELI